jgi:hypothetical protein
MNQNPNLYDNMEINLPVTGIPFMERFNDYVGGISIDAEVVVFEDINACDYYDFSVSPSPTPTPTNTPTSSPIDVTPTPTITPTPNSYSINFASSGATFDDLCSNPQPIPTLYSPQPFFTNEQELYYDSALTQFIDWNTTTIFLSTGGTQLYFYGFATFGLGTYGFSCPSSTPTPTPTSSALPVSPTATPTKTPTPTPTLTPAACKTYKVTYGPQKVGGSEPSFTYTDCSTGLGTTIVVDRFDVGAVYNVCVKRVNNNYAISTGACNCDANFTFEQLGNC